MKSTDSFGSGLPSEFLEGLPALEQPGSFLTEELQRDPASIVGATHDLARAVKLAKLIQEREKSSGFAKWFDPNGPYPIEACPKHKAFFEAGADYPERMFLAANRTGKSIAGVYELTCHLTGHYPFWWAGRRFEHPVDCWAVGPDARTVRDTLQKELLGPIGEWGTGMVPASLLGKFSGLQGTSGAIDTIRIKHITGGWSSLGFKNYKQDIQAFMGTSRHVVLCDEECPIEIWNECNIRTATTQGIMLATFTPLEGLTRMVVNFCKNADFLAGAKPIVAVAIEKDDPLDPNSSEETVGYGKKKAVIQAGWDDVLWLDEETKARLLADTPEHLREARSKGIPSMGAGNVYSTPIEQIICNPFTIPDNWPRMYGLDVGWNITAAVWGALDPNSDILYIYDEHYQGKEEAHHHAYAIKQRGDWIPGAIDPASQGLTQTDGKQLYSLYKKNGLILHLADNSREAGIQAIRQRLSTGRLRIFSTLTNLQREYMLYRRNVNGKVLDEDDHALDALRYIVNNLKRMLAKSQIKALGTAQFKRTSYDV